MVFDIAVVPVLGFLSPTNQPIVGASEGAEVQGQPSPRSGGQTPALQRGEGEIQDAQNCAPTLSTASECTLQRKPEVL